MIGETVQLLHLTSKVLGDLFLENVHKNKIDNMYVENINKIKDELKDDTLHRYHSGAFKTRNTKVLTKYHEDLMVKTNHHS